MQPIEIFGFVAVVVIAAGLIVAAFNYTSGYAEREEHQSKYCRMMLTSFARDHDLHFDERSLSAEGRVDGMGMFVNAAYDQLEPGIPVMVTMSTLAQKVVPVLVQTAPSKWALSEWIASERVETGDADFDAAYKVWTDVVQLAPTLLSDDIRRRLLDLAPDEFLYNHGVMELRWEDTCDGEVRDSISRLEKGAELLRAAGGSGRFDDSTDRRPA